MPIFTIWFSIYDKKMKVKIEANNKADAEYKLRGKIIVDKIEEIKDNPTPDFIDDIFKQFKGK